MSGSGEVFKVAKLGGRGGRGGRGKAFSVKLFAAQQFDLQMRGCIVLR